MQISRRRFGIQFFSICFSLPVVAVSCKNKSTVTSITSFNSCTDMSKISESDLNLRRSLAYVPTSPIEESNCGNCNLWLPPPGEMKCGGCTLFAGPVYTEGYCTYWAPQL